jgi:hypothetical protein
MSNLNLVGVMNDLLTGNDKTNMESAGEQQQSRDGSTKSFDNRNMFAENWPEQIQQQLNRQWLDDPRIQKYFQSHQNVDKKTDSNRDITDQSPPNLHWLADPRIQKHIDTYQKLDMDSERHNQPLQPIGFVGKEMASRRAETLIPDVKQEPIDATMSDKVNELVNQIRYQGLPSANTEESNSTQNIDYDKIKLLNNSSMRYLDLIHSNHKNLTDFVGSLNNRIIELSEKHDKLHNSYTRLKRYGFSHNCLIHGIPEERGEHLKRMVKRKLKELNMDKAKREISKVKRLGGFRENQNRPILISFTRIRTRDKVLSAFYKLDKHEKQFHLFTPHTIPEDRYPSGNS